METRRDRWAAKVYSSTTIAVSATVGWRPAVSGRPKSGWMAPPAGWMPMATWAAPIAIAAANAATGYRWRGTTVAASSTLTAATAAA